MIIRSVPAQTGLLLAALGLSACVDSSLDACGNANRDVNIVTLAGNTVARTYEQCIADLRTELQTLRLEAAALDAEAARLNAQAAALDGERRTAAQRLATLNAQQAALARQISQAQVEEASVPALVQQERQLRSDIAAQGEGVDAGEAEALRARQQELNRLALELL